MWNDDWDGAPLILKDYLITGGENSWFHIIRLNRSLDPSGTVQWILKLFSKLPAGTVSYFPP